MNRNFRNADNVQKTVLTIIFTQELEADRGCERIPERRIPMVFLNAS